MKPFYQHWWIALVTMVGLVSGLLAIFQVSMTGTLSAIVVVSSLLAACGWGYAMTKVKQRHLPDDVAPVEVGRVHWPCDSTLAHQASVLARRFYGREAIPFERYEMWRLKNPDILVCLTNPKNEVVGYFDVLPLKHSAMDMFIQGSLLESSFSHEDVCPPTHALECERLYLAGIAVKDPERHADQRNAAILVWVLVKYLEHFYTNDGKERDLFALGSTKEGDNLIRRFGFELVRLADVRQDHHNLYKFTCSRANVEHVMSSISDWGKVISLPWNAKTIGGDTPMPARKPRRPTRIRKRTKVAPRP